MDLTENTRKENTALGERGKASIKHDNKKIEPGIMNRFPPDF
jgi:hypothetical protein